MVGEEVHFHISVKYERILNISSQKLNIHLDCILKSYVSDLFLFVSTAARPRHCRMLTSRLPLKKNIPDFFMKYDVVGFYIQGTGLLFNIVCRLQKKNMNRIIWRPKLRQLSKHENLNNHFHVTKKEQLLVFIWSWT